MSGHVPVLLGEVLAALGPRDRGIYVDGTFGGGGYSRALLEAADCTVWGIDRDTDALARGAGLAKRFAGRLHLVAGSFGAMDALIGDPLIADAFGLENPARAPAVLEDTAVTAAGAMSVTADNSAQLNSTVSNAASSSRRCHDQRNTKSSLEEGIVFRPFFHLAEMKPVVAHEDHDSLFYSVQADRARRAPEQRLRRPRLR